MLKGIVYKSTGSWYQVKSGSAFYECTIKGKLRLHGIKSTNPIAVGDHVAFELLDNDAEKGVISEILERKNYIIRRSVNLSKQTHIIAANIDQVFLMITLQQPTTHLAFIDRFLVTAQAYRIPVVLLFNKADILDTEGAAEVAAIQALYENIGYTTLQIAAKKKIGVSAVREMMYDKVSMFAGHSGVGKSTLANALAPELQLHTAPISTQHQQGQHTTTFAQMYDLDDRIRIVDTPGIKGFGVVDISAEELGDYFPEILALKSKCKFNNCLHIHEPQCAVTTAVEAGAVAPSRYRSYRQLLEEETNYR
jgi:ribosome biogenesis GTPase